ncbi:protein immune deficiency [Athalia rosae]|uniref:protein immune deficiency n=1 Tax=Athalia rosae TaxID=37344 RepID=UPI0020349BFB|nr:protein immune deficiency [Athalia rosae]XP_012252853.2 protein immune deficiency [Athalia rosae]XP_012252855.2 protein immune deficiency [Athalia rosae]
MSVLSALSRRLQTLTTDAKPDPPRVIIEDPEPTSHSPPEKIKQKSAPVTPEPNRLGTVIPVVRRQSSSSSPSGTKSEFTYAGNFGYTSSSKPEARPKSPRAKAKPKYKTSPNPNIVNYNIVNSNGVKIGSKTSYICNINQYSGSVNSDRDGFSHKQKAKSMPPPVEALSSSKEIISIDDMFLIKTHIGYGWRDLARSLGYSEGQIEQFEENHKIKGVDQVVYQILLDWKQTQTKDAQLGEIISKIWLCQEYDCAERLAASHKTSK